MTDPTYDPAHDLDILRSDFDREPDLGELLQAVPRAALHRALEALLQGPVRLVDVHRREVLVSTVPPRGEHEAAIEGELEPLGWLQADTAVAGVAAGAAVVTMLCALAQRYRMAAALHAQTVEEDFHELRRRHTQLQASEAKYRKLAGELEQRVALQVEEIDATRRQLYQAEKLAAVGQLAAGVAHEVNNPIGFIASNLSTAMNYVSLIEGLGEPVQAGAGEDARAYWAQHDLRFVVEDFRALLQESREGAERVSAIVRNLGAFARPNSVGRTREPLDELVRNACAASSGVLRGHQIALDLQSQAAIECDAPALGQLVINLLANAALATPGSGGSIHVSSALEGGEVRLQVKDTGVGMAPGTVARACEPFFTTRDVGAGSGLGLTVARDIVRAHGGTLSIDSEPGRGTCVTVRLPLAGGG